jgi:hypothetical protein
VIQAGAVASRRGTARSSTPSAVRRPVVNCSASGSASTRQWLPATVVITGTQRTSSKVYVAATNPATRSSGASRMR